MVLFALTLPGLVIVIIALGVIQLMRARVSGRKRPGSATVGVNLLDVVLKPGSENRILEQESIRMKRKEDERDAPPFSEMRVGDKSVTWKVPPKV